MTLSSNDLLDLLRARLPAGVPLRLPPPCLMEMQGEPIDWNDGVSLTMRFPVLERWQNPLGYMQGGFIAAALDNTLGPFSYLIAPPSVTSQFNLSYLRPVGPSSSWLTCIATLVERTSKTLYLAGEAQTDDGKTAARCHAVCQLL
jgi:acyl-coenzyme A thioesterase PaaI-like protein